MSKELFMEIFHGVREFDNYFKLKHDAVGTTGSPDLMIKCGR
jgi:hypothetical protein